MLAERPSLGERPSAAGVIAPELQRRFELHPLAARVLAGRAVTGEAELTAWLDPRLARLRPPTGMAGFGAALDRLDHARRAGTRVAVFGDYDVDGVTTAALLGEFLQGCGVDTTTRVARRDDGYGCTTGVARALCETGARTIVLADCGTSDHDALEYFARRGVECVVIDHHQVPEVQPRAGAFINPHQPGCDFPFKGLCSAGVGFYLCAALRTRIVAAGGSCPDPRGLLDLAALATVCDLMPLVSENRILVRHGLDALSQRRRPGLGALLQACRIEGPVDEGHVGFRLGPRINAPGRLGSAEPALALLRARTTVEASAVAAEVEAHNARRRTESDRVVAEARAQVLDAGDGSAAVVVAARGWIPGVAGIAAGRLAEEFGTPAVVLAIDDAGTARGSVRSAGGVDVRAALADCSLLLRRFGGHREAAGLELAEADVPGFRDAFRAAAATRRAGGTTPAWLHDGHLLLEDASAALGSSLRRVGPFGMGFERPRFLLEDVVLERVVPMRGGNARLVVRQGVAATELVAFGESGEGLAAGATLGALVEPALETFRGVERLRLHVAALWRHS